ncbi:MAG TPA: ROK family protein [Acidimicrobiales bacterium]|jgi:polyphosphate glucokinase|nr:ROK family protein [Acidimicrobiales bacterium]
MSERIVMGVDIGGTGIKGAPVDVEAGELAGERFRVLTPRPATPKSVSGVVAEVVEHFDWNGPVGAAFPAVVKNGVTMTAANVNRRWVGTDAEKVLTERLGMPTIVLNDADAAGLAEVRFGAGRDRKGTVVLITLGTGIGCGMFHDGELIPNTELGHIEIDGKDAETLAADSVRERKGLSWKQYAGRVEKYIRRLDALIWPDLVILGGGASKNADKLLPHLDVRPEVVAATLLNEAGIVGAAVAAAEGRA